MRRLLITTALLVLPLGALAQDDQTLADVRQELNVLFVEVQKLQRELSTTGGSALQTGGGSVLERVSAMESELQRLTAKTEELENRINRIVADGTNRIGDLEFRLVELEGGDISTLGETTTLGGEGQTAVAAPLTAPATPSDGPELAIGEKATFERAQEALASGDFRGAADLLATFAASYPGSPLTAEAAFLRGKAYEGLGEMTTAARGYLDSFSADSSGANAPEALFRLGNALGAIGQVQDACVTLAEVGVRFPGNSWEGEARRVMTELGCS